MKSWFKNYLWPMLAAIVVATFTSIVLQTQRVIGMLQQVGAEVPVSQRLSMTTYDLQHLGTTFIIFVAIALLIALTIALLLSRKFPRQATLLHIIAGASSICLLLYFMQMVFFGLPLIAGARDALGMVGQLVAGGLGGYVFYRLRKGLLARAWNHKKTD